MASQLLVPGSATTPVVQPAGDVTGGHRPEVYVAGFSATGTSASEYVEDSAHVSGNSGTFVLAVRNDAGTALAGTDGDYIPLATDANGNLRVTAGSLTPGTGATDLGKAEDAASASGDTGIVSLVLQKASPANLADTDADYAVPQMSDGRLWASAVVTAAAASIGKAEDVASADSDVGVPAMAIQKATPANTAGADGDYEMLQMFAGRLWTNANLGHVGGTATDTNSGNKSAGTLRVVIATDQPALSNPLVVDTELPAAAALADAASNPTAPLVGVCVLGWNGATWDRARIPTVFKDLNAVTITTITTVWTPTSGKKFRLQGGHFSVSAAASVLFEDNGAGTTIIRTPKLLADTPFILDLGNGVLSAAANNVLKATSSAAAAITGHVYGTEE